MSKVKNETLLVTSYKDECKYKLLQQNHPLKGFFFYSNTITRTIQRRKQKQEIQSEGYVRITTKKSIKEISQY
jgi:hypothetical protein